MRKTSRTPWWLTALLLLGAAAAAGAQTTQRAYSVLLGGSFYDEGLKVAVDAAGQAWVVGPTGSPDFPFTAGPAGNIFIARLSPAGELLSAISFGGSRFDQVASIHLDAAGNLYLAGMASSPDFPVTTSLARPGAIERGFVAKLDPGGHLVYSTVFGGTPYQSITGLAVDAGGHAHVVGSTRALDFPTANALFPSKAGEEDMFVVKLSADGSRFVYSTYLGGSGPDSAQGIAVDSAGNAHVTGFTNSADFPQVQPLPRRHPGGAEAVVAKLSADGSRLIYSTLLGGSGYDWGWEIAVDRTGNALVYGDTTSTDFPVRAALQPEATPGPNGEGPFDTFLTRLSPAGALLGSTYFGGSGEDGAMALTVDSAGFIYLLGYTASPDFPLRDPLPIDVTPSWYLHVGSVTKLDPQAAEVLFSTFLDGTEEAMGWAYGIAVDAAGSIHVTGYTNDPGFPLVGPSQRNEVDVNGDAFALKIALNSAPDCSAAVARPATVWPPDGRMVPILLGGVTDPDGDPLSLTVTAIHQDEPLSKKGQPDATGLGTALPRVRADRAGNGDGRVYRLTITATDPSAGACTGTVTVCVSHDRGKRSTCEDGGPFYDSTAPPL